MPKFGFLEYRGLCRLVNAELFAMQVNGMRHVHHIHHATPGVVEFPTVFWKKSSAIMNSVIIDFLWCIMGSLCSGLVTDAVTTGDKKC